MPIANGSHDGHGGGGILIERRGEPVHESITLDHEVVGFFAVSGRATIDANAQPRPLATMPPIDAAAALFETRDARLQQISSHPQRLDLGGRWQQPVGERARYRQPTEPRSRR